MDTIWMVKGSGPASHEHASLRSAEIEAARLARENPGVEFTVLVSVKSFKVADIIERDRSWDGIPF